ncbi:4Fe-4S dicluster domain-containing protein [candidate division KSB1 bacterium]|nr:4Fe-4S dicluster domain-containing protein [candidate division KSB1 bacterium]
MKVIDKNKLSIAFTDKSLCTRSGTCIGVCPTQALSIGKEFYPEIDPEKCIECGLCAKTCPGGRVMYKDLTEITFGHRKDSETFDGYVSHTFVGHASDKQIRQGGAGGGVITALLADLLDRNIVQGCIVTRMKPDKPWHGEAFIARNSKDLLASQQSKYIIIPLNAVLQEIKKEPGIFAYAGLPCHIHGLRLFEREQPKWREKIRVVIGLFCASALEPYVAEEMLECRGIDKKSLKNFHFRGGEWPGRHRAILNNKQIKNLHYSNFKDGAINYLTYLYSPFRCQTCIDGASEFSDISVSDAWTRNEQGQYLFQSQSKLLVRTSRGLEVIQDAIESGALIASDVTQNQHYQTHRLHTRKKGLTAPIRVERLKQAGKTVPLYDRTCPTKSSRDRITEWLESSIMKAGEKRSIRYPLFKFLTSRYGIPIVKLRQYIKSRKYRKR